MTAPRILVTAAAGSTGAPTVRLLLQRGLRVRAMVRREDARSRALAAAGAEIVVGSLLLPADIDRALAGVQRAYFCAPFTPWSLQAATHFAGSAEEHRLEAIAVMSQWIAHRAHPSSHTRNTWLSDQVFAWMPTVATITLNPGFFADNYLAALEPIAQFGLMTMPLGRGRNAPPSNDDIAAVVAAVLADPETHAGRTYRPTGPELLDPDQLADHFAQALDRPVRYRDVPFALLAKVGRSLGYTDYAMEQLRWYIDDYRADAFAVSAPTDVVEHLTGMPAQPFHAIVTDHIRSGRRTTRTTGNALAALAGLARVMATPAPRLARLARTAELPSGDGYTLAAQSTPWLDGHGPDRRAVDSEATRETTLS